MAQQVAQISPVGAFLSRYVARRDVSISELSRRTGRSRGAIRNLLQGKLIGLKPWQGGALFWMLVRELEIPEREARKAIADHFESQAHSMIVTLTRDAA